MPFTTKDLRAYRRDEQYGHKLMTPEERIQLLKVGARSANMRTNDCSVRKDADMRESAIPPFAATPIRNAES